MTKAVSKNIQVPFRYLAAFLGIGCVLFFAAVLTYGSLDGLQRLTEQRARDTFTELASDDAENIRQLLVSAANKAQDNAQMPEHSLLDNGHLNIELLTERLVTNLRSRAGFYGAFVALANGESFRVLAIRADPVKEAALNAPPGTFWAVQHIEAGPDGQKQARWAFWNEFRDQVSYSAPGTLYSALDRPWWKKSRSAEGIHLTGPYFFLEAHELGVTLSHALANGDGVIGMAVSLNSINDTLKASLGQHQGGIVVLDATGRAVGASASGAYQGAPLAPLDAVAQSTNPFYAAAAQMPNPNSTELKATDSGPFVYVRREVIVAGANMQVVAFSPMDAYAGPLREARWRLITLVLGALIVMVPLALYGARRLTRPLTALTAEAERISAMDFSERPGIGSNIAEIHTLCQTQQLMKKAVRDKTESLNHALSKLEALSESGIQLATERKEKPLMERVVAGAVQLLDAQVGQYWQLHSEHGLVLTASVGLANPSAASQPLDDYDPCSYVLRQCQPLRLPGSGVQGLDLTEQSRLLGLPPKSLLAVPVMIGEKPAGVLLVCGATDLRGLPCNFTAASERYLATLAAQAGVSLGNVELQKAQGSMMDSLIKLLAGAIDAKSAYTAGHCNRVPELAFLLLDAVNKQTQGPFADFCMDDEDDWREFRIGAWLHDCGKVTTPEYVVDKASKLEIIYNRIHEIRMRFEVLLRDAHIARLQAVANGADPQAELQRYEDRYQQLQDDYAFIASCNIGGEFMPSEHTTRLRALSGQTWLRHFDDRLGLSHGELRHLERIPPSPLPVREHLLADKTEHIIPRTAEDYYDERLGFRMEVPECLYNFGELHNLSIQRGTLSPEERFKINEHIMQTIVMLEQLPLPDSLKRVPEYAGTHHETMTGTGYPRGLTRNQLSVPARIMAVADIFEALTASDRPYKKAKTLSEAIKILSFFKKDGHIDPDLFDLLLSSGVYLKYAETFLDASQIDEVDVGAYMKGSAVRPV